MMRSSDTDELMYILLLLRTAESLSYRFNCSGVLNGKYS